MGARRGSAQQLATRLRRAREREKLSLSTLAFLLAVPRPQLEGLEAGSPVDDHVSDRVRRWLDGAAASRPS